MYRILCQRHPDVKATCDLVFPQCSLCEECRLLLIEKYGFDITVPLRQPYREKYMEMTAEDLDDIISSIIDGSHKNTYPAIMTTNKTLIKVLTENGWHEDDEEKDVYICPHLRSSES